MALGQIICAHGATTEMSVRSQTLLLQRVATTGRDADKEVIDLT
jgi:hypothetical protein